MSYTQLSKLWFIISAFSLYYALNSAIVAQGGTAVFGAGLIASGSAPIFMMAIPIVGLASFLSSLVGWRHAARRDNDGDGDSDPPSWAERFPLIGFSSLDMRDPAAKVFQGLAWFLFSVLPLGSLIHFWSRFWHADVARRDDTWSPILNVWDFAEGTSMDPARICSDYKPAADGNAAACLGNATIIPGWYPWIFVVLTALAVLMALVFWQRVLLHQPRKRSR